MLDGQRLSLECRDNRQLSRRRLLATLAASAGAAVLAACGSSTAPTSTAKPAATTAATSAAAANPTTAPATTGSTAPAASAVAAVAPPGKGKILRFARNEEPGYAFVGWSSGDNSSEFTMINLYDGLVRPARDGVNYDPALASKWETSPDGKTWTFTLRDAKFSDGKPIVSADVKASLDMARTSPASNWKSTYKQITEVQAPDD